MVLHTEKWSREHVEVHELAEVCKRVVGVCVRVCVCVCVCVRGYVCVYG